MLDSYISVCFFASIGLTFLLVLFLKSRRKMALIVRHEEEKYFLDVKRGVESPPAAVAFPSLYDDPSVDLSVIIPAYNEEERLPSMLDECVDFLESRTRSQPDYSYEIILVSDGSSDRTTDVGHGYAKQLGCDKLRVLSLIENRGKGGAVRLGMLSARGKWLLFADADGATKFGDIEKLEAEMRSIAKDGTEDCVVVGSRAHLEQEAIATRSAFRTFLMRGFHTLVWLFAVRNVRDTQCGFKLFTRQSARKLFAALHIERWAFDVELLYIASRLGMRVSEVAVNWTEIEGSKLVPFWSWIQMGRDLLLIWLKYQMRIWTINVEEKKFK